MPDEIDATDLAQVVLHLRYLRADLKAVSSTVTDLATQMATRAELESVRTELNGKLDKLRAEVNERSASNTFERMLTMITKIGAAIAVLMTVAGLGIAFVHFLDGARQGQTQSGAVSSTAKP